MVIVDDHAMVRESIALALGRSPELDVVGAAASVREGRALVQELHPDVAVVDYGLPDGTGIALARSIHEGVPPARTIVLTASEGIQAAAEAVAAGCSGFVRKSADLGDLADGVLRVHRGEAIFDHVRNILGKLDARSQLEAVVIGASTGLVSVGRR